MFTSPSDIRQELLTLGYTPDEVAFVRQGVMTDKYVLSQNGQHYIVRCYPPGREWLAEAEFHYLKLFESLHLKVPKACRFKKEDRVVLVYEMLEGQSLSEVYDALPDAVRETLCRDIVDQYREMARIRDSGFGQMSGFRSYAYSSWNAFLSETIAGAEAVFKVQRDCR